MWAWYSFDTWYPAIILGESNELGTHFVDVHDNDEHGAFFGRRITMFVRPDGADFQGRGEDDYIAYFCYHPNPENFECRILNVSQMIHHIEAHRITELRDNMMRRPEVQAQIDILAYRDITFGYFEPGSRDLDAIMVNATIGRNIIYINRDIHE